MPVDDLYWNSIDFGSEEEDLPSSKPYVDPWDLENYAYIQQHLDSSDLSSEPETSGEFTAEANSTSFYYVPGTQQLDYPNANTNNNESGNYAAIDEIDAGLRNLYVQSDSGVPLRYTRAHHSHRFDSEEFDENPYEEDLKDVYVYETKDKRRKIAAPSHDRTPIRDRSLSFSYGDYGYDPYGSRKPEMYAKLEDYQGNKKQPSVPLYDDVNKVRRQPRNFGLSNYGHLKIDYSYSWNNLDKYIGN